jgi:hypothetical protein
MKSSNMTQALYKSLLMLKEIRVILLQRPELFIGSKGLHGLPPPKRNCRSFALNCGAQDDMKARWPCKFQAHTFAAAA